MCRLGGCLWQKISGDWHVLFRTGPVIGPVALTVSIQGLCLPFLSPHLSTVGIISTLDAQLFMWVLRIWTHIPCLQGRHITDWSTTSVAIFIYLLLDFLLLFFVLFWWGPGVLFYVCEYTVALFRHTKGGRQISLQMVVSHHVVAGIWTPDLQKSSQVLLPTESSHQPAWAILSLFLVCHNESSSAHPGFPQHSKPLKAWAKYNHSVLSCSRRTESLTHTESECETSRETALAIRKKPEARSAGRRWRSWGCKLERLQDALSRAGGLFQEELEAPECGWEQGQWALSIGLRAHLVNLVSVSPIWSDTGFADMQNVNVTGSGTLSMSFFFFRKP